MSMAYVLENYRHILCIFQKFVYELLNEWVEERAKEGEIWLCPSPSLTSHTAIMFSTAI